MPQERPVDQLIRDRVAMPFRRNRNVLQALRRHRESPEYFGVRVAQFEAAIGLLNASLADDNLDPTYYRDVIELRQAIANSSIPPLDGKPVLPNLDHLLHLINLEETDPHINISSQVGETLQVMAQFSGRWAWANDETDPNILATRLLGEGYGLFISRFFMVGHAEQTQEEFARKFILAFEEVVFMHHMSGDEPSVAELMADVLPWMEEEADDFPPGIKALLTEEKS